MKYKLFVLSCFVCFPACEFLQHDYLPPHVEGGNPSQQNFHSSQASPEPFQQTPYSPHESPNLPQQAPQSQYPPSYQNTQPLPQPQESQIQSGGHSPTGGNSQTILVQKSCCACSGGGYLVAIPRLQEASHYSQFDSRCGIAPGACMMVFNCDKWKEQCRASPCSQRVLQQIQ